MYGEKCIRTSSVLFVISLCSCFLYKHLEFRTSSVLFIISLCSCFLYKHLEFRTSLVLFVINLCSCFLNFGSSYCSIIIIHCIQILNEDHRIINLNTYGPYAYNILCEVRIIYCYKLN